MTAFSDFLSLILTISVGKNSDNYDCIQIEIDTNDEKIDVRNFVKCKVTLLDAQMNDSVSNESVYYFEPDSEDDVWKYPTFIKTDELFKDENAFLKDDVLMLRFEFSTSRLGGERHVDHTTLFPSECCRQRTGYTGELNVELKRFYKDRSFCDVTLSVGYRDLTTHKVILCARSSVFRAMFQSDMKEKETGVVDIEDIDPDTLDQLLEYMYADDLDGPLDAVKAAGLYVAANKYQITMLNVRCASYLLSTLSMVNVCEVLTLADLYADHRLMKGVQNFIHINADECFRSSEWDDFMEDNAKLALKNHVQGTSRKDFLLKRQNYIFKIVKCK